MNAILRACPNQLLPGPWGHCQPWLPLPSLPRGSPTLPTTQHHISAQPGAIGPCPSNTAAVSPAHAAPDSFMLGHRDAVKRRAQIRWAILHTMLFNIRTAGGTALERARAVSMPLSTFQSRGAPLDLSVSPRSCSHLWHTCLAALSFSGVQVSGL